MASTEAQQRDSQQLDTWLLSKESLLDVPREDQRLFMRCSPAEVQREIEQLKKKNTGPVSACLERMQPFFDGIQSLDAVIAPIASLEPHGIGGLLWGTVKICLDLVQKYTKLFDTIEGFLCKTGRHLEQLQVLGNLYGSTTSSRFSDALANVFAKYVAFYRDTKEYFESSRVRKFRETVGLTKHSKQALVTLSMDLVKEACEVAIEEASLAEKLARAMADKEHSDALSKVEEKFDEFHAETRSDKAESIFQDYLKWLKHVEMETIIKTLLRPKESVKADGTGAWIFADDTFRDWTLSSKGSTRVLWLTGDPGFGKSTLSASIVTQLRRWQPTGCAYFFCRYQDSNTRTISAILRTWIWQLLRRPRAGGKSKGHCSLPEAEWTFTSSEYLLNFFIGLPLKRHLQEPSCEIMCDVMRQLFQQRRPTRLIVDGLDECREPLEETAEENDWEDFFELLRDAPDEWKILIVSRPRTWYRKKLLDALGDKVEREITSADNGDDIQDFIQHKLQDIATGNAWSAQITNEACDILSLNAKGMFMWVSLFCTELRHKNGKQEDKIRATLQDPPKGIYGFYRRSMDALGNLHPDLADDLRTALKWILCAPRALRMEELESALEMTPAVKGYLEQVLGSFIRVDAKTREILLVHVSAREYLLLPEANLIDDSLASDQAKLVPVHAAIFTRCLRHMCDSDRGFVHVGPDQRASEQRIREALEDDPLLEYSCIYWIQHYVEVAKRPTWLPKIQDALDDFLSADTLVLQWLQMFHFLFQFNFAGSNVSRHLIGNLTYHPPRPDTWQMFLHTKYESLIEHLGYADGGRFTRWDRFMHVRHEFIHHAEPQRWFQSPTCFPGLSIAAFFNYLEPLRAMISSGTPMDGKGPLNGTPLLWAATADSCATLKFLLDAGANKEVAYAHTRETPVFRTVRVPHVVARRPGRYPTALLLHKRGAKLKVFPDDQGWIERTVLITLIEEGPDSPGARELTREIIKDDASRHGDYVRRGSVLQTAAWFARTMILEALLEDEHVKSRVNDQVRATAPLHDACTSDNPATVRKLLDANADVNLRSVLNGFRPLHFTVMAGGRSIPTLLDASADPTLGAFNNDTAVHLAAAHNVHIDFELFLDKGFKVDHPNALGQTALAVAIEHSNDEIVGKLLDIGADPGKVQPDVLRQKSLYGLDERLLPMKKDIWRPCWSFELCFMLKQRVARMERDLPIPIITRILHHAGIRETLTARREGRMTVNETMTLHGAERHPYISSPPIFGGARNPVHRVVLTVFGRCQSFGGERAWSFYEAKTVERTSKRCMKWQPERIFGHNGRQLRQKREVVSGKNEQERKHLERLRPGDRVAIIQRAHFPGWENTTEWASIEVEISVLRDRLTEGEMDRIWKHAKDRRGRCKFGWCFRCAIGRATKMRKAGE